ncbi:MAG: hypothetical protein RIQ97_1820 [Pseudomonadota bacterium]|jgi:hypothetical protein
MNIQRIAVSVLACASMSAMAQALPENVIYFGGGQSAETASATTSTQTPGAIGYLHLSATSDTVWGIDIGFEGTMLDSTWGQSRAINQGTSYNLVIGHNLHRSEHGRVDAMLLAGLRETTTSCPRSYIGYQCYADTKPDYEHSFNGGAMVTYSYRNLMVGLRLTSVSRQVVVGLRF